jgi:glycosyltransferase involved in cell wall biosynthesis
MRVSVITPVRNGGETFRVSLSHLAACVPTPDEIIVVIDGASDGDGEIAASLGACVIQLPVPVGAARARNAGVAAASGEVILFIDADVVVPPDLVGCAARELADDTGLAAVVGSYDDEPADAGLVSQYRNLLHHYVHQTGHEDASTFWCGCGAIRRDVLLSVGGFDNVYSAASIEDIELGYRLRRAGHRIRLCKSLQVKHLKRWTPASMLWTDIFARAVPWTRLTIRSRVLLNDLNLRTSARASVVLVFVLIASLAAGLWSPWAIAAAAASGLGLTALNAGFYTFLWRKRGPRFTLASMPWHWLYYACGGIGFAIGVASEILGRPASAQPAPAPSFGTGLARKGAPEDSRLC